MHIFKEEDVPRKFLPLGLVRILASTTGFKIVAKALNFLNPLSSNNQFKKYLKFAETGKLGSQKAILEQCAIQYPSKTTFIALSMDMSQMNAGKVPRPFQNQLTELIELSNEYPDVLIPFVHVEPNNPDYLTIFTRSMKEGFQGIKFYPPVSCHLPTDYRMTPVYEYCNKHKIPMIAHCGAQSPTHYHTSKKKLRKKLDAAGLAWTKDMKRTELCGQFTHPRNYIPLLEKYPDMKICLGHWGSEIAWEEYLKNPGNLDNWFYIIRDMMKKYPNLYTDISFTLNNQEYFSVLKVLLLDEKIQEKVLFGTDYYMVETKTDEKKFCFDLRAYLGEDLYKAIAVDNPEKFLKK